MSVLIWNIRGIGCKEGFLYLKKIINHHRPLIVGILEPKQHHSKIAEYAAKLGFDQYYHGAPTNTHIWIFLSTDVRVDVADSNEHQITVQVGRTQATRLTFIYAKCNRGERQPLWNYIHQHSAIDMPWVLGGDFNTILCASEKRGGLPPDLGSIQDFQECMAASNLTEVNYEGDDYTWCNNQAGNRRIWQRLDRVHYKKFDI